MKTRNLNFLEPSGPVQACNGTALPFTRCIHNFKNQIFFVYKTWGNVLILVNMGGKLRYRMLKKNLSKWYTHPLKLLCNFYTLYNTAYKCSRVTHKRTLRAAGLHTHVSKVFKINYFCTELQVAF